MMFMILQVMAVLPRLRLSCQGAGVPLWENVGTTKKPMYSTFERAEYPPGILFLHSSIYCYISLSIKLYMTCRVK